MSSKNKAMYYCSPGPRKKTTSLATTSSVPVRRGCIVGKGGSTQIVHVNFDYLPSPSSGVKIIGFLGMMS